MSPRRERLAEAVHRKGWTSIARGRKVGRKQVEDSHYR
jgi:hypothetical protein